MTAPCSEAQARLQLLVEVERAASAVYALGMSGPVSLGELRRVCGTLMWISQAWLEAPAASTDDARRVIAHTSSETTSG